MIASSERKAYALALGAVALWSTVAVAFKLALKEILPLDLVTLATLFSWTSLGAVLLLRPKNQHRDKLKPKVIIEAALLGLLNPLAYYWILFAAYHRLPAQAAQPLNYTWPLFLALLAAPMTGKRPTKRDLAGLLISLVGVLLISLRPGEGATLSTVGIILALGSGIIWAYYWLAGTRLKMDGTLRLFIGFSTALPVLGVIWWRSDFSVPLSTTGWLTVFWVGLFEMGLTFLLWNKAMESTERPARIGNLVYLGPFISLLWISLFLGEAIRPATVAGLAVIISGILTGQSRKKD